MNAETEKTALAPVSLVNTFAEKYGVEAAHLLPTLKATAFKQKENVEISNEQMMALLVVADQYDLNPFTGQIFAFPDKKGGIVPVVGVDGWSGIINGNPALDGIEFVESDEIVNHPDGEHKPCPAWIECVIHREDRNHPTRIKEHLDECYKPPHTYPSGDKINGHWQTHTKRALRHKALIQCARVAFSYSGIYDEDEAHNIIASGELIEGEIVQSESTADINETLKEASEKKKNAFVDLPEVAEEVAEEMTIVDVRAKVMESELLLRKIESAPKKPTDKVGDEFTETLNVAISLINDVLEGDKKEEMRRRCRVELVIDVGGWRLVE